jgi:hypothetical protein
MSVISVPDDLRAKADLYQQRNAIYGDNYKRFGPALLALTGPIQLETAEDFNRFGILVQLFGKVSRYAMNFANGGHDDSLDDAAVYAMMLKELDNEARQTSIEAPMSIVEDAKLRIVGERGPVLQQPWNPDREALAEQGGIRPVLCQEQADANEEARRLVGRHRGIPADGRGLDRD